MTITIGTHLDHYKIVSQIGAGGMGEVYMAEDTKLVRKVAIKTINEVLARDANKRRRFVQEAKAASALNPPNILTVHEISVSKLCVQKDGCVFDNEWKLDLMGFELFDFLPTNGL